MSANPRDYGALGNGTADDTAPFEAASAASGGVLRVPQGQYLLSRCLRARAVTGEGIGVTELRWRSGSASSGILALPGASWEHSTFSNLTLSTEANGGTAIALDYTTQIGSDDFTHDHILPRFTLSNLLLCGVSMLNTGFPSNSWFTGVEAVAGLGGVAQNVTYIGKAADPLTPAQPGSTGIHIRADGTGQRGHPDQFQLQGITCWFADQGILFEQCEGLVISAGNLVACNQGIVIRTTYGHPQAVIRDTHTNCLITGIQIDGQFGAHISGCLIFCIQQPQTDYVGLHLLNTQHFQALGNTFASLNATPHWVNHLVVGGAAACGLIDQNTFRGGGNASAAIWVQSGQSIRVGPSNLFNEAPGPFNFHTLQAPGTF